MYTVELRRVQFKSRGARKSAVAGRESRVASRNYRMMALRVSRGAGAGSNSGLPCYLRPPASRGISEPGPHMPPRQPQPSPPLRIVVTDDNPQLLMVTVKMLVDAGHAVFAAYDGQSACELAEYIPNLDLVISNTRMRK